MQLLKLQDVLNLQYLQKKVLIFVPYIIFRQFKTISYLISLYFIFHYFIEEDIKFVHMLIFLFAIYLILIVFINYLLVKAIRMFVMVAC